MENKLNINNKNFLEILIDTNIHNDFLKVFQSYYYYSKIESTVTTVVSTVNVST